LTTAPANTAVVPLRARLNAAIPIKTFLISYPPPSLLLINYTHDKKTNCTA
jgi:hypothetical protein